MRGNMVRWAMLIVLAIASSASAQDATATSSDSTVTDEQNGFILPVARRQPFDPSTWQPKTSADGYKPATVDWAGVIASCRLSGQNEHRIHNYFLRAVFHDALTVDTSQCTSTARARASNNQTSASQPSNITGTDAIDNAVPSVSMTTAGNSSVILIPDQNGCVGALDGSIFTQDEVNRGENIDFASLVGRVILRIAAFHDASVADTLAICGAVAAEDASNGTIKIIGSSDVQFTVGRLDSTTPSPGGQLFSPEGDVPSFVDFWGRHGFSAAEGAALLGTHSLLRMLGCSMSARLGDDCQPAPGVCQNVRMFRLTTNYYQDVCTPTITILPAEQRQGPQAYNSMPQDQFDKEAIENVCAFSSEPFRNKVFTQMQAARAGTAGDPFTRFGTNVQWTSDNCQQAQQFGVDIAEHCPHRTLWPYTVNDAHLGRACQGLHGGSAAEQQIQAAMRDFVSNPSNWARTFQGAYVKMVNQNALFDNSPAPSAAGFITGNECPNIQGNSQCASIDAVNGLAATSR